MRKFLLCLDLIFLVSNTEVTKKNELTEEQKKLIKATVIKLAEKLVAGGLDEALEWIKKGPLCCRSCCM